MSFYKDVRPIFLKSCVSCHRPEKIKGKLDLATANSGTNSGYAGLSIFLGRGDSLFRGEVEYDSGGWGCSSIVAPWA